MGLRRLLRYLREHSLQMFAALGLVVLVVMAPIAIVWDSWVHNCNEIRHGDFNVPERSIIYWCYLYSVFMFGFGTYCLWEKVFHLLFQ